GGGRPGPAGGGAEVGSGRVPQERGGEMQVAGRTPPEPLVRKARLPLQDLLDHLVGERKRAEEANANIVFDATSLRHTRPSRLWDRSRRARCSAPTVARARIDSRSPGNENSRPASPSAVTTWR